MQCFTNYLIIESTFHLMPNVKLCCSQLPSPESTQLLSLLCDGQGGPPRCPLAPTPPASAFLCAGNSVWINETTWNKLSQTSVKMATLCPRLTFCSLGTQEKEHLFPSNSRESAELTDKLWVSLGSNHSGQAERIFSLVKPRLHAYFWKGYHIKATWTENRRD